jgi:hypothetical protein
MWASLIGQSPRVSAGQLALAHAADRFIDPRAQAVRSILRQHRHSIRSRRLGAVLAVLFLRLDRCGNEVIAEADQRGLGLD